MWSVVAVCSKGLKAQKARWSAWNGSGGTIHCRCWWWSGNRLNDLAYRTRPKTNFSNFIGKRTNHQRLLNAVWWVNFVCLSVHNISERVNRLPVLSIHKSCRKFKSKEVTTSTITTPTNEPKVWVFSKKKRTNERTVVQLQRDKIEKRKRTYHYI